MTISFISGKKKKAPSALSRSPSALESSHHSSQALCASPLTLAAPNSVKTLDHSRPGCVPAARPSVRTLVCRLVLLQPTKVHFTSGAIIRNHSYTELRTKPVMERRKRSFSLSDCHTELRDELHDMKTCGLNLSSTNDNNRDEQDSTVNSASSNPTTLNTNCSSECNSSHGETVKSDHSFLFFSSPQEPSPTDGVSVSHCTKPVSSDSRKCRVISANAEACLLKMKRNKSAINSRNLDSWEPLQSWVLSHDLTSCNVSAETYSKMFPWELLFIQLC